VDFKIFGIGYRLFGKTVIGTVITFSTLLNLRFKIPQTTLKRIKGLSVGKMKSVT